MSHNSVYGTILFFLFKWKGRHWKRKHNPSLFSVDSLAPTNGKSAKKHLVLITFSIYDGKLSSTIASSLLTCPTPTKKEKKKKCKRAWTTLFLFFLLGLQYKTSQLWQLCAVGTCTELVRTSIKVLYIVSWSVEL